MPRVNEPIPAYKVVTKDRYSCVRYFVKTNDFIFKTHTKRLLLLLKRTRHIKKYEKGKLVVAPKKSIGIMCFKDYKLAKEWAKIFMPNHRILTVNGFGEKKLEKTLALSSIAFFKHSAASSYLSMIL